MSENVYRVLMGDNAPFLGLANISYLDRTLKGVIKEIHYEPMSISSNANQPILNQTSYRTVDVEVIEGKPYIFKNVHIPELVSFLGYGLNYLPSKGDAVLIGFDSNNNPLIINIVSRCSVYEHGALSTETLKPELNKYGDVIIDDAIQGDIRPTPIRYITPGEISLASLNGNSELYFDKKGTAKLISRIPVLEKEGNYYKNGLQCGDRLWEVSIGQDIVDEGTKEIKQSSFGNNIQFQVLGHQNGCKVDFDGEGNIEVQNKGNNLKMEVNGNFTITTSTGNSMSLTDGVIKISDNNGNSITLNSDGIQLGDNADFSAVLGESLNTLLSSMIEVFNSHVHPGVLSGPASTGISTTQMKLSDVLSKTIKLKQ